MDNSFQRRAFLRTAAVAAAAAPSASPVNAAVRPWRGKPTLFIRNQPTYACFYALTDCVGGRFSFEEGPRQSIRQFVAAGFKLFQLDLFLADCWPKPGPLSVDLARRQIRGILDVCPDGAVVLRWHLNVPEWWKTQHPDELTRYANGDLENPERTVPVRYIQDDLRRTPRASLASEKWMTMAREKTAELVRGLAASPEAHALAGVHVACGVYGEWHYWGFMRNEPDVSRPMQERFTAYRKKLGRSVEKVPDTEARKALDSGVFRDPKKREAVIDYYRCQQEMVAERIIDLCAVVKQNWRGSILTGTFYGYFFSMFDRQATGGHLELHKILHSPHVDYLSAPQAYGTLYRDLGGSGITRALIETIRLNGKLFLDEMDQTPSWKWINNVDTAFQLTDLDADHALIRRNVLESFTRGAGLWYYDFGPGNQTGWWADTRLMAGIKKLKEICESYHQREYAPAGDVLFVFDTEVFYYTGSIQGTDPVTDPLAVNKTMGEAWRAGAAIETIHLKDLEKINLDRFKVVVFANTWLMTAAQRKFVREKVHSPRRRIVFQGFPAFTDGVTNSAEFTREVTGGAPVAAPPIPMSEWRRIFAEAGAHLYVDAGEIIHAGGGLLLVHTLNGGQRQLTLRSGKTIPLNLPPKASWLFDAATGERLL
ncbi:MAG: hypothetical protein JNM66_12300 [Bryobacterales bacterium]|nr:hypothetical protein [Bryobacterales bacterium]